MDVQPGRLALPWAGHLLIHLVSCCANMGSHDGSPLGLYMSLVNVGQILVAGWMGHLGVVHGDLGPQGLL